jgi:hypothetical protein
MDTLFLTSVNATKFRLEEAFVEQGAGTVDSVRTFGSVAMAVCGPDPGMTMKHFVTMLPQLRTAVAPLLHATTAGTAPSWTRPGWYGQGEEFQTLRRDTIRCLRKWYKQFRLAEKTAPRESKPDDLEHEQTAPGFFGIPDLCYVSHTWLARRCTPEQLECLKPWTWGSVHADPGMEAPPTSPFTVLATWWLLRFQAECLVSRGEDTCNWAELRVALGGHELEVSCLQQEQEHEQEGEGARKTDEDVDMETDDFEPDIDPDLKDTDMDPDSDPDPSRRLAEISVDEASDLTLVHCACAIQLARTLRCQLVLVGDPRQHIYGFTGAQDVLSMDDASLGVPVVRLPLSTCFRLPRAVLDLALALGAHTHTHTHTHALTHGKEAEGETGAGLRSPVWAPPGRVLVQRGTKAQGAFVNMVRERHPVIVGSSAVAVLFRSNKDLMHGILDVLADDPGSHASPPLALKYVLDARVHKDLATALKRAQQTRTRTSDRGDDAETVADFTAEDAYAAVLDEGGPQNRVDVLAGVLATRYRADVLSRVQPYIPGESVFALGGGGGGLFTASKRGGCARRAPMPVHLLTVHSSKGSEFDTVIVDGKVFRWSRSDPPTLPHNPDPVEFVGITRSKSCLVLATQVSEKDTGTTIRTAFSKLGICDS